MNLSKQNRFLCNILSGATRALSLVILLGLSGCFKTKKVEIPNNEVGVVYNKFTGEVNEKILRGGVTHNIAPYEDVFLFNVKQKTTSSEIDIMFIDATTEKIKLELTYRPIAESLPVFIKRYQKSSEGAFEIVINSLARSTIRAAFLESENQSIQNLDSRIEILLKNDTEISDFIKMDHVSILSLPNEE